MDLVLNLAGQALLGGRAARLGLREREGKAGRLVKVGREVQIEVVHEGTEKILKAKGTRYAADT